MKKPRPALVLAVAIPFLQGCVGVLTQPVPEPAARSSTRIRGIVVERGGESERIEPDPLHDVVWTDSTVVLTGAFETGSSLPADRRPVETRSYPLSTVTGVLVRQLDGDRTSILVAATIVGGAVIAALLFTGSGNKVIVPEGG